MDRERWTSFPAATAEERALLGALEGFRSPRTLGVVGPGGASRSAGATLSIVSAAPFDGRADVVARLTWESDGPAEDERPEDDLWTLLDDFLAGAADEARRRAAAGR